MKKIFVLLFVALQLSYSFADKLSLSSEEQLLLNKIQLKMIGNMNKGGVKYLEKIENSFTKSYKQENNKLIPYLLEFIEQQKEYYISKDINKEYNDWIEKDKIDQMNINTNKIRNLRLERVNEERTKRGKNELELENKLNWTATIWTDYMMEMTDISHKRNSTDSYYTFESIKKWFLDKNVKFKLTNSTMFCENIGVSPFRCFDGNCEEAMIQGLKEGFEMMMDEQFQDYKAHYLTIINGNFKIIGFGFSVDFDKGLVFYTAHYGTELE